jgi:hypothetical protein
MNLSTRLDRPLTATSRPDRVDGHAGDELRKIEAADEAMVNGVGKESGVLTAVERLVGTLYESLQLGQHRLDPSELRQPARLAFAHDDVGVRAAGVDRTQEAGKPVAHNVHAIEHERQCPLLQGFMPNAAEGRSLHLQRAPSGGQRRSSDERHLHRRAASAHAGPPVAEVGIAGGLRFRNLLLVGLGNHTADLLLMQPRRAVANAKLAHRRRTRKTCLDLSDKVEGEGLRAQRHRRVVENHAGGQRRPISTGDALQQPPVRRRHRNQVALRPSKFQVPNTLEPADLLDNTGAKVFAAVALGELAHRHTGLELDLVEWHGIDSDRTRVRFRGQ